MFVASDISILRDIFTPSSHPGTRLTSNNSFSEVNCK